MLRYETLRSFCATDGLRPATKYPNFYIDAHKWVATDARSVIVAPLALCHPDDIRFLDPEAVPEGCGKYPNYKAVIDESFTPVGTITTEDILQALDKCPMVDETHEVERPIHYIDCTCDDCEDGETTITDNVRWKGKYYDIEEKVECPICHGYGKIPDWDDYDPSEGEYDPDVDKTYFADEPTGKKIPDLDNSFIGIGGVYFAARLIHRLLRICDDMQVTEITHSLPTEGKVLHLSISGIYVGIMPACLDSKARKTATIIEL